MSGPTNGGTTLDSLALHAELLARAREQLGALVQALQTGIEKLKADKMPEIREAIDVAAAAWQSLAAEVKANPQLFVRPRTVSMHGIKFGYQKGAGGLVIPDPARTVKLIKRHFPGQVDVLISTVERPARGGLEQLPVQDLKRVGVEVKGAGDRVVIKPADAEIDAIVAALLKAVVDDAEAEG